MTESKKGPWSPKAYAMFWALGEDYYRRLKDRGTTSKVSGGRLAVVIEAAFLGRLLELDQDGTVDESLVERVRDEFIHDNRLSDFGLSRCDAVLNEGATC
ncbi:hypothetical protein GCM10009548_95560 [Streptomyces malaysiensis subsp. malaysiensis]|uniref:Uncharacterized protein n=1 Tax=Zobellella iuensis TaxID=2803811 RepID=A0ABS1QN28_9GAMM|nr:hypothetical protein [Zobellella iuensis]MBL1376256.1 hypothetical protein [Zobellella iuensis]